MDTTSEMQKRHVVTSGNSSKTTIDQEINTTTGQRGIEVNLNAQSESEKSQKRSAKIKRR